MPPRLGKLDAKAFAEQGAREILGYKTEPWTLKQAQILNFNHEIDDDLGDDLLPRTMHPAIPAYATFTVIVCPESPVGALSLGEVKSPAAPACARATSCYAAFATAPTRAANSPSDGAIRPCRRDQADRAPRPRHRPRRRRGPTILEMEMLDRDLISGNDIQYIANMHLARNKDDGQLVLVQVDPDFVFSRAERGRPLLRTLDSAAWGDTGGHLKVRNPISMSYAVADIALPRIRFICDPGAPGLPGNDQGRGVARQEGAGGIAGFVATSPRFTALL